MKLNADKRILENENDWKHSRQHSMNMIIAYDVNIKELRADSQT